MSMKWLIPAVAFLGSLALAPEARAWGAYHVGYTHVGPGGVQHYGHTAAVGPYGGYSGSHYGAYGYGGASYHAGYGGGYHAGYGGGYGGYHYGAASYGGYAAGGFHYGGYGGYRGGVYRRY